MALLTCYWGLDGILIFLSVILVAYLYMTRNFKYWINKGVMEMQPTPFIGNFADCMLFRMSPGEWMKDLYDKGKGLKYLGFYIFDKPFLLLRDPAIIKNVLIKDFNFFVDRHVAASEDDALGTANLFILKNPHWKNLRNKLTPVFSTGKIKKMFRLMTAVTEDLDTHLEALELHGNGRVIELKETCAKYATDVIASCAYGLNVNSLNNPNAEFRNCGRKIFTFTYRRSIEFSAFFFAPGLVKPMDFKFFENSCSEFLRKALWGTMKARTQSGDHRDDLIDTLIELRKAQTQADINDLEGFKFDGDNLVAQAAVFFTAGFETSSTTMSFSMYELALQPDLQTRLRTEITSALEKSEKNLTYEMVMNLPYFNMVISETLRKYPPLPFLDRVAARDYQIPGSDLVIEKGLRFGLLQAKLGLIKVLSKYEVTPCDKTLIPMRLDPKALLLSSQGGLYLHMRKITTAAR